MSNMKDSGITWCGQIPNNWDVMPNKYVMYKKKELCPVYNGEDILSLTMDGVIVRDLEAGGKMPATFDGYQIVYPNNLLMCLFDYDVTPRCIGLIKNKGLTSPAYSQFVMKNGNNPNYYYYYYLMLDNTKELLHLAKNLRHSFTEDQLGAINTPVPPIEEQERIALFLDSKCTEIDSLYADIEKQVQTLEEYKKSVITEAVTKGLNHEVEMKDSGIKWIGLVPKSWKKQRLVNLASDEKYSIVDGPFGSDMKNEEYTDEGIPIVQLTNIKQFNHYTDELKFITEEKSEQLKRHSAYQGDIVIAKMMPAGRACILKNDYTRYVIAADAIRYKCSENVNNHFILYCLNTYCMSECEVESKGTTRVRISLDIARRLTIFLPPYEEQNTIAAYLDRKCYELDEAIKYKKEQLNTLNEYRKSIIYEYVTGKKEVPVK